MPNDREADPSVQQTRAGYVALLGLPNAGKSSLLNALVAQKLSIVSAAAQTTRERVVGIDTRDGAQIVFLDTPGLLDPRYLLHQSMRHSVEAAAEDADVVVFVVDGSRTLPELSPEIPHLLRRFEGATALVALNKADVASKAQIRAAGDWARDEIGAAGVPVSARTLDGIPELRARIVERLPISPFLFPPDEVATQSTRFFVSELIRETVFELYGQEIPYSAAVKVDEFREGSFPLYIRATIYVERATQKGILVGRGGAAMKRLSRESRLKIEAFLDTRVYLDLWVKVLPRWRKDPLSLERLGYSLPRSDSR